MTLADYQNIARFISQDKETTKEQKERQLASASEVAKYCFNKTDCRRVQVLSFFSEKFDPAMCKGCCDVCLHRDENVYTTVDVTTDAISMIKMVQAFRRDDRITRKNAAECYRGINGASGKDLKSNEYFGVGKHWAINEAERLVEALVLEGALKDYSIRNKAGFSSSYIEVSIRSDRSSLTGGQQRLER